MKKRGTRLKSAKVSLLRENEATKAEGEMLTVYDYERVRRAYYIEKKSIRRIEREMGHSYWTVRKALDASEPEPYQLRQAKVAPVLGPYKAHIEQLLAENGRLPRKQRYTSKKIYQAIRAAGYPGAESTVRYFVAQQRKAKRRPAIYLPLDFDPGVDAQVDWGEAHVILAGEMVEVQLFVMRLCYSRKLFVMAFPTQRQEAFLLGHVQAFAHFGGVPQRISYDNLKTAVRRILEGRGREEQTTFTRFRSHYLFESRFCTPGQGHEKGGVENDVGYVRRNFLVPMPEVADFDALNRLLLTACQEDDLRQIERADQTIGARWQVEAPLLHPLPKHAFACCTSLEVTLNGYGQVSFESNRYSVPAAKARKELTLRVYPFHIEILADNEVIATHTRSYGHKQDVLEPLHYLPLLEQRPGAFEHAQPMRQWRAQWPPAYETLLTVLRRQHSSESQAVRTFIQILQLHQHHEADQIEAAVEQALDEGLTSLAGVRFCLNRLLDPTPVVAPLDLSTRPDLLHIGRQPAPLERYNQFLAKRVTR
jgi:transposase